MIVQLLLIGLLLLTNSGPEVAPERLLELEPGRVSGITLAVAAEADADASAVELTRSADGWLVDDRRADDDKIDRLLDQLTTLGPGWPVATTSVAQERFAVTDDGFRKKLTFTLDDGSETALLLGTSPGFKRLHARLPESDAVFSIALGDFDLPAKPADWLDKALLALGEPVLAASRREVLRVERESVDAAEWQLSAPAEGGTQAAAAANVERWLERFQTLRVVAETAAPEAEAPDDIFVFATPGGELTYALYHDAEADRYTMRRNDVDGYYEVPSYIALQLRANLESLLPVAPEDAAAPVPLDSAGE
ncbi:MAG: DUF4340 domain-containing protein [Pseudomonadota bacterium]